MQNIKNDFFHENITFVEEIRENQIIYGLNPEYGKGRSSIYNIIPGLYLCFNNLNVKGLLRDNKLTLPTPVIEIDYCLKGQWIASNQEEHIVKTEEGRTFFFAGMESYNTVDFKNLPYRSLSLVCCKDEISCLPGNILGLTTKTLHNFHENIYRKSEMETIRTDASTFYLLDAILKSIKDENTELMRLRVLELFLQEIRNMEESRETLTKKYYNYTIEKVKLIKETLDRTPNKHIPIKSLAKQFGLGETTMKGCFKSVYSVGIYSYLKNIRIQTACERLENSEDSIVDIANQVGYTNPSKFSAAFRDIYGVSPLKYRQTKIRS